MRRVLTESLAGDGMEGRDVGSAAYQRAAEYVAGRFRSAGLQPCGGWGTFFQPVAMHEVAVEAQGTSFTAVLDGGKAKELRFLQDINKRLPQKRLLPARSFSGA